MSVAAAASQKGKEATQNGPRCCKAKGNGEPANGTGNGGCCRIIVFCVVVVVVAVIIISSSLYYYFVAVVAVVIIIIISHGQQQKCQGGRKKGCPADIVQRMVICVWICKFVLFWIIALGVRLRVTPKIDFMMVLRFVDPVLNAF